MSWTMRCWHRMARRKQPENVSTFAFTATPKSKTMELFGVRRPDGSFAPFHLYSMRQAIEEGFILDVLESYTTYRSYWKLYKTIEDDPRYDKAKAAYLLKAYVDLHPHAIEEKVRIMLEHFMAKSQYEIGGKAKAMIVTRSRLHAVRYKLAVDRRLAEIGKSIQSSRRLFGYRTGRRRVLHRSRNERFPGSPDGQDIRGP